MINSPDLNNEEKVKAITRHGVVHKLGMCFCPCYDIVIEVAKGIQKEKKLMVELAKASPEVLAAMILSSWDSADSSADSSAGAFPEERPDGD